MAALAGISGEAATTADDIAMSAAIYHLKSGGQRLRAKLALHTSVCVGLSEEDGFSLAATAELLHNASLIHDDLQDRDRSRRGRGTVWVVYGEK